MKVCLIAEGCYPYLQGGVSSWIHSIINSFPEHTFILVTVIAEDKKKGKFVYQLPSNLSEVHEFSFQDALKSNGIWGRKVKISKNHKEALLSLLKGDKTQWGAIFELFKTVKQKVPLADFVRSKTFFDVLIEAYSDKYEMVSFTELFWTIRSVYVPLFYLISNCTVEADLYHAVSTGYGGVIGSLCKWSYEKPLIVSEHGIYTREREEEIIKADWVQGYFKDIWINFFHSLSDCAYGYADRVTTLFEGNKSIQLELGCSPDKIRLIPNGIDVEEYYDLVGKTAETDINIGAITRVVPIKDIKTMLMSFDIVKRNVPNAKFYIMGQYDEAFEYYEECLSLLDSLGTKDVKFMGNINVKEYIGMMDILVLTSISEGQPIAMLEGMAAAKPHVATNVGSVPELLYGNQDGLGNAGLILPIMEYVEIANEIIKLCYNHSLREKMGTIGRERVSRFYTRDRMIKGYQELYDELRGD